MPNLTGNSKITTACEPTGCGTYRDTSLYMEDGALFAAMIDIRKLKAAIVEQMHKVGNAASSDDFTTEDLMKEIRKLGEIVRVLHSIEEIQRD